MIPLFVTVQAGSGRALRLPLFVLWLLLVPFVLVLLPFAMLGMLLAGIRPLRALGGFWAVLAGMRGTHIEFSAPGHVVLVHVS